MFQFRVMSENVMNMDVEFAADYAVKTFCGRRVRLNYFYLPVNMISVYPFTVSNFVSSLMDLNDIS